MIDTNTTVELGNELERQFIEIVKSTMHNAGEAKNFLVEQAPEVVQQALIWYGVYGFIQFLLALMSIGLGYFIIHHLYIKKGEAGYTRYGKSSGDNAFGLIIFSIASTCTFSLGFLLLINLQWLKIWIAPKIWLIEFASNLVK